MAFIENEIINGNFGPLEDSVFVRIFNGIEDAHDFYRLAEQISDWMASRLELYELVVMLKQAVGVATTVHRPMLNILGRVQQGFNIVIAQDIHRGPHIGEETIAGLLMDADVTATELKTMMADIEYIYEQAAEVICRLLFEPAPHDVEISNVPIGVSPTEMELYRHIQMHNIDENNNPRVYLPNVAIVEMVSDDDDAVYNNDVIDSDLEN